MYRTFPFFGLLLLIGLGTACGNSPAIDTDQTYSQDIESWHQQRIEELMAPDGWLALAGLFWLKAGPNTFGSDAGHPIVFPEKAPDTLGTFWLEGDSVFLKTAGQLKVKVDDREVSTYSLSSLESSPIAYYEDLSWILIQRTNRFGIRLWDQGHPKLSDTIHIDRFSVDPNWRIQAEWIPDSSGHTVRMRNVLDMEMDLETEGRLRFSHRGHEYELTALDGGEDAFFLIFADETSGDRTYPGGRYLYADRPNQAGITYLDFNKAYNPPCAFTEFATCLLPPAENRLPLAITAGELDYGAH